MTGVIFEIADPQGADALALLRQAAIEARALYPELHRPDAPWPANPPTPVGGVYLVGSIGGQACVCGALRPMDAQTVEIRRMFVLKAQRHPVYFKISPRHRYLIST